MSRGTQDDPQRLIQRAKTVDDVRQQLNLIERALSAIDPQTDYQAALLNAMNEVLAVLREQDAAGGAGGGAGLGVGGSQKLETIIRLLEQQIMGQVDTTALPIGLEGEARVTIQSGNTGLASMDFAGGRYSANVKAKEDIEQFEDIRVVGGDNLVAKVPEEEASVGIGRGVERAEVFSVDVDAGEDILDEDIQPKTKASRFTAGVVLDTSAQFRARVKPVDESVGDYDAEFNGQASSKALGADEIFHFDHDFGTTVNLNYRVNTDGVTVQHLRIIETIRS